MANLLPRYGRAAGVPRNQRISAHRDTITARRQHPFTGAEVERASEAPARRTGCAETGNLTCSTPRATPPTCWRICCRAIRAPQAGPRARLCGGVGELQDAVAAKELPLKDRAVLVSDEHKCLARRSTARRRATTFCRCRPPTASMYENGNGVAQDYAKALAIYSQCRSPPRTRRGPCRLGRNGSNSSTPTWTQRAQRSRGRAACQDTAKTTPCSAFTRRATRCRRLTPRVRILFEVFADHWRQITTPTSRPNSWMLLSRSGHDWCTIVARENRSRSSGFVEESHEWILKSWYIKNCRASGTATGPPRIWASTKWIKQLDADLDAASAALSGTGTRARTRAARRRSFCATPDVHRWL